MTEYFRTHTPPVPPVVKLRCSLHAERRPVNAGDPGGYNGPPEPDDIRGWLDAQTAEYRNEALAPFWPRFFTAANVCEWLMAMSTEERLATLNSVIPRGGLVTEIAALKSQLSAAVAERDAAQAELARVEDHDTHADSVLDQIHELVWTGTNRAKLDDLPGVVRKLKGDLTSARENIREHAAANVDLMALNARHAETIRKLEADATGNALIIALLRKDEDEAKETIRAITVGRDAAVKNWSDADARTKLHLDALGVAEETIRALTEERNRKEEHAFQATGTLKWCASVASSALSNGGSTSRDAARLVERLAKEYRALTEERDEIDAALRSALADIESREAPESAWQRGCQAQRKAIRLGRIGDEPVYEPPRSEEERDWDVKPDNATRFAPLTDRERRIVSAAQEWHDTYAFADLCELAVDAKLWQAVDLPKTPDVRREDWAALAESADIRSQVWRQRVRRQRRELKRLNVHLAAARWACVLHQKTEQLHVTIAELKADNMKLREANRKGTRWVAVGSQQEVNELQRLERKLRLATEQVEALKRCHEAAHRCVSVIRGHEVPSAALTDGMTDAFVEYEAKCKERGWT